MVAQILCQTLNKEVHICRNRSCSYLAVFGYTNADYHIITHFWGLLYKLLSALRVVCYCERADLNKHQSLMDKEEMPTLRRGYWDSPLRLNKITIIERDGTLLLTRGAHAQHGLQHLVCVCVCVCVCACVCLSDALFLEHGKLIHWKEGAMRDTAQIIIRRDFTIDASFKVMASFAYLWHPTRVHFLHSKAF